MKVEFRLEVDDGWPPVSAETVWASPAGRGLYRLDNVPFFARGVSHGDVVRARKVAGFVRFVEVVTPSPSSTVRVVLFDAKKVKSLRDSVRELGCSSEWAEQYSLVAIDVPGDCDYSRLRKMLDAGCKKEWWDYQESALRHSG